ncbi:MAG TPA: hypothetical protein VGN95_16480 [Pyrinomonadaceae bacterium]|jgi:hypothetical protein|nr:hypothetical protein [Pyrinomonadaceae bacterium]
MLSLTCIDEIAPLTESDYHRLMRVLADRPKGKLVERAVMSPGWLHFTVTVDLKQDSVTVYSYQKVEE